MGRCSPRVPGTWVLSGLNRDTTARLLSKSLTTNKISYCRVSSLTCKNDHLTLYQVTNAHGAGLACSNSGGSEEMLCSHPMRGFSDCHGSSSGVVGASKSPISHKLLEKQWPGDLFTLPATLPQTTAYMQKCNQAQCWPISLKKPEIHSSNKYSLVCVPAL